ncbi:MAG TPA: hypothetical protein VKN99_20190 [Polyangia bacterium]|nr:hypothetical protein [Polyangia bacterium]
MKETTWTQQELSVSELQNVRGGADLYPYGGGVEIDGDWGYRNLNGEWWPENLPIDGPWFNFDPTDVVPDENGNGGWGIG